MNKVLVALLTGLFAAGVYAADDGKKTRPEVKAEAAAASKKGEIASGEASGLAAKAEAKLTKEEMVAMRAAVKAEGADASKKGKIASGEASGMAAKVEAKLSKEEMAALRTMIKAEAAAALKKGAVKTGEK